MKYTLADFTLHNIFNNPTAAEIQRQMEIHLYLEEEGKIDYPANWKNSPYKFQESFHKDNQVPGTTLNALRDAGILVERITNKPSTLMPTLAKFDEGKAVSMVSAPHAPECSGDPCTCKRPIVISRDNFIADGHHRTLAHYNLGDKSIVCDQVNLLMDDLIKFLQGQDKRPGEVTEPMTPKTTDAKESGNGLAESFMDDPDLRTILETAYAGLEAGISEAEISAYVSDETGISEAFIGVVLDEAIAITPVSTTKRNFGRKKKITPLTTAKPLKEAITEAAKKPKVKTVDEIEWEEPLKILKRIHRSSAADKVSFKNGKTIRVDVKSAGAILHMHKHLSEPNKVKIEKGIAKNSATFKKIRDWAMGHTTALRESEELQLFEALKRKPKHPHKVKNLNDMKPGDTAKGIEDEDELAVDGGGAQKPVLVNPSVSGSGSLGAML